LKGEDVRLLHAVLNWHLPPPSDQLPVVGDGAFDFGPRTEKKVKEFQKLNKIDIGTRDFMDGIVGPNTRAVLEAGARVDVRMTLDPETIPPLLPGLKPLLLPPLTLPPMPQPPVISAPKLHLDNVQVQAGFAHTINATRPSTSTVFIQASYVMLWKNQGERTEFSAGLANFFSVGPTKEGNDVLQIFGQVSRAQIPLFGSDRLTAALSAQLAGQSLLTKPFKPAIGVGAGGQFQWEVLKHKTSGLTLSLGAQGMANFNVVFNDQGPSDTRILTAFQLQGFANFGIDFGSRNTTP
jgi:hypothetical protein